MKPPWKSGAATGLRARGGGIEVSIVWSDKKIRSVSLTGVTDCTVRLKFCLPFAGRMVIEPEGKLQNLPGCDGILEMEIHPETTYVFSTRTKNR